MDKQTKFFVLLIERYAWEQDRPTADVLREWENHGIVQEVFDGYEQYHTERIENAFEDIDSLIATGQHAR